MSHRRIAVGGAASVLAAGGIAVACLSIAQGAPTAHVAGPVAGSNLTPSDQATTIASRRQTVAGVAWTISEQDSTDGPCVGVVATTAAGEQGQVGGACGEGSSHLRWGVGGLSVEGTWFNVAYGLSYDSNAASVRVDLADGRSLVDDGVAAGKGLWLEVYPADPTSSADDVSRIVVSDPAAGVLADVHPASLAAARARAQAAAIAAHQARAAGSANEVTTASNARARSTTHERRLGTARRRAATAQARARRLTAHARARTLSAR